jgi:hypothetical protein
VETAAVLKAPPDASGSFDVELHWPHDAAMKSFSQRLYEKAVAYTTDDRKHFWARWVEDLQ